MPVRVKKKNQRLKKCVSKYLHSQLTYWSHEVFIDLTTWLNPHFGRIRVKYFLLYNISWSMQIIYSHLY